MTRPDALAPGNPELELAFIAGALLSQPGTDATDYALRTVTRDCFTRPTLAACWAAIARAWEAGDMMKTVDGVIDLMVVCEGFLASLGIDGREGWEAVMKANFSKVDSSLGPIVWREDGQIGKPEGFVPPDAALRKIVDRAISVQKE
jgi:hypothetical protein